VEHSIIKVWDSFSSEYCHDLAKANGFSLHINTFVLSAHPQIEEILMSGSEGGVVCLWNLKTKQFIKKFLEYGVYSFEKYTMSNPCDGRFSPDGSSFVIGS
jgi:WD40 repeat protein